MTVSHGSPVDAVLKASDVRGTTPDPFGPAVAAAYAVAFGEHVDPGGGRPVVLGRDTRTTSPLIADAVAAALTGAGSDVLDVGVCSTDLLYFASGEFDASGIMITASHNPAGYNGMKFVRAGARPLGRDDGLSEVAARARTLLDAGLPHADTPGARTSRELLDAYARRLRRLSPVEGRPLTVVVDAGNAVAGVTAPAVFAATPVDVVALFFEPDGTFPNHDPDPLAGENLVELQQAVRENGADAGLAFDGDADRCFVVDERGELVSSSAITSLIAARTLAEHPGATILHNVICSRSVPETIEELGGTAVRTPVGHALIKRRMGEVGARFGGEHSGHFYFADFFLADSGMLAALHVLGALAAVDVPLSALVSSYARYVASGEINSTVADPAAAMRRVESSFTSAYDVDVDHLDGVTVSHRDWWFNLRPSNTEPKLRLNVEATDAATMHEIRESVLRLVAII